MPTLSGILPELSLDRRHHMKVVLVGFPFWQASMLELNYHSVLIDCLQSFHSALTLISEGLRL